MQQDNSDRFIGPDEPDLLAKSPPLTRRGSFQEGKSREFEERGRSHEEHENARQIRRSLPIAILLLLLTVFLIVHTRGSLKAASSIDLVYVESNIGSTPNSNSVFGFTNSGGVLTAITGSPWPTGGTGVFDPGQAKGISEFDADQQVIIIPQLKVLRRQWPQQQLRRVYDQLNGRPPDRSRRLTVPL
ncbi:MAG TPA: hypothetical protein VG206_04605 [Terriglobia bacterium]|nr:hypothetical protein [Terriglobia bacterium]